MEDAKCQDSSSCTLMKTIIDSARGSGSTWLYHCRLKCLEFPGATKSHPELSPPLRHFLAYLLNFEKIKEDI